MEWVGMLIVEGLGLLKDLVVTFIVDGLLPHRSERSPVCGKKVLYWVLIKLLRRLLSISPSWHVPVLQQRFGEYVLVN